MNSKDNLQRALKKAFEDHKEPLHEAQWDRLSAVLDKEKSSKKRFLPWFFITFGALLLAVAIGIFMSQKSPATAEHSHKDNTIAAQSQAAKEDTFSLKTNPTNSNNNSTNSSDNSNPTNSTPTNNPQNNNTPAPSHMAEATTPTQPLGEEDSKAHAATASDKGKPNKASKGSDANKRNKGNLTNGGATLAGGSSKKNEKEKPTAQPVKAEPSTARQAASGSKETDSKPSLVDNKPLGKENPSTTPATNDEGKDPSASPSKPLVNATPKQDTMLKPVDPASVASANNSNNNDSTKPNGKKPGKKADDPPSARPRFAIGFSSGIGTTRFMVNNITNASKIHKDASLLFQRTNEQSKANHFNFNFEWYPIQKFAIGFAAGLQYRSIVQTFDFNYKLNQVALRDTNENIRGYFFVPDSSALTFKLQGRNQLNYVNVPIRVMYTLPINNKNELLFSAGISTSFVTKANGQAFSINTTQLSSLSDLYKNKVNVGWSLGLQYSYNVYKQWWLGSEFQYQQNKYNYSLDYGILRSRIKITNYNLAVRYKF